MERKSSVLSVGFPLASGLMTVARLSASVSVHQPFCMKQER